MHPCNFKNINSTTRPAFCEDFITVTSTKGFLEYILIVLVAFLVLTLLENNLPCTGLYGNYAYISKNKLKIINGNFQTVTEST